MASKTIIVANPIRKAIAPPPFAPSPCVLGIISSQMTYSIVPAANESKKGSKSPDIPNAR